MDRDKKQLRTRTRRIVLLILFSAVLLAAALNAEHVLGLAANLLAIVSPVFIGLSLAFVLNVPMSMLEKHVFKGMKASRRKLVRALVRPMSLTLSVLLALGLIALAVLIVIPEFANTFRALPGIIGGLMAWVDQQLASLSFAVDVIPEIYVDWDKTFAAVAQYLTDGSVISDAALVTTSVISGAITAVFSVIIALYVLAQKERLGAFCRRAVEAFLPERAAGWLLSACKLSFDAFFNFISGQFIECLILGVLCFIGMSIFGFPYALIISVFVAITAMVPMIGSAIGEVVGAALILTVSPLQALLFVVFILCLQWAEGSFIYPRVVGNQIGVPGLLVLVAVVVGSNLGGFLGAFISVPSASVLYILIKRAMQRRLAAKAAAAEPQIPDEGQAAP